jgi:hypothetical protein
MVLLSRRRLLRAGLFGGLAVTAGSVALALQSTAPRGQLPQRLAVLTAQEYAILAAIAARVAPAAGTGAPGADALEVALRADALLARATLDAQKGLKLALVMFDNALPGALFGDRIRPFTRLSAAQQDRVLSSMRSSRVAFRRQLYAGLAGLIMALYWGDTRTWPRIGYPGPPSVADLRAMYADNLVDHDALAAKVV